MLAELSMEVVFSSLFYFETNEMKSYNVYLYSYLMCCAFQERTVYYILVIMSATWGYIWSDEDVSKCEIFKFVLNILAIKSEFSKYDCI